MRIEITDSGKMAYLVKLTASREMFGELLASFKNEIPRSCRSYNSDGQYWHVERRAVNALRGFVEQMRAMGAAVIERQFPRSVQTVEEMAEAKDTPEMSLRRARARGFLRCSADAEASLPMQHLTICRAEDRPAIQLLKLERWCELRVRAHSGAMTDPTKTAVFQTLISAVMPGGQVRASNREVRATRLPFAVAEEIALWLAAEVLCDEANIIAGSDDGREWSRFEARKRNDGSIKMVAQPCASTLVA